ncbi:hypothetical protein, partial [Microcystis aeruginosa]
RLSHNSTCLCIEKCVRQSALHPTPHTPHPTFLSALVMIVIGFFNRINKNAPKKEAFFNLS